MAAKPKFLQGQLLLDSGQLGGSFFQRTVVLICQHNAEGAFGLVLNRSLGKTVGEMIVADLPNPLKESPLYLGGPVQPGRPEFSAHGQFHSRRRRAAEPGAGPFAGRSGWKSAKPFSPTKKVRLFAGYAGWSPGQLESEMKRKAWLTFPASVQLVFETPPEQLWQKVLLDKGGWRNKLLAQMPEDLSWN